MSNEFPPPPPAATPNKKGLGPFAWLGMGCAGLIVLSLIVAVAGFSLFKGKFKQLTDDFQENPAKAAAEMAVRFNPQLELVQSDEAAGTITFRERDSGKETTISYQDMKEGKFTLSTDEGVVEMNLQPENGEEPHIKIQNEQGEPLIESSTELSGWVEPLLYPSATETTKNFSVNQGNKSMGSLIQTTADPVETVAAFYKKQLEEAGYSVSDTTINAGENAIVNVTGKLSEPTERQVAINLVVTEGKTTINFVYSEEPANKYGH